MVGQRGGHFLQLQTKVFGLDSHPLKIALEQASAPTEFSEDGAATTVPIPGFTVRSPSEVKRAMTLCAVFGLIFSIRLSERTEGNDSPGCIFPETNAFFAA